MAFTVKTSKEQIQYMDQKIKMCRHIVSRFKENGGKIGDLQGRYMSGGEADSRKLIIEQIGELEGMMLLDQLDSLKKPRQ